MPDHLHEGVWRLLLHSQGNGAWNMAVDESILYAVAAGEALPTLRFYGWHPACLSLGRAQSIEDIDLDRLRERNWGLVRRPTGGRAILHQNELTYAVIAPEDHPLMRGGVLESYRRISEAFVHSLERLAVRVEVEGPEPVSEEDRVNPICFEAPSAYEITAAGKKLIGSAQVRKRQAVLQHGSLPLEGDLGQICEVLCYPDRESRESARESVLRRATTMEMLTGRRVPWQEASEALMSGFQQALSTDFVRSDLTPFELKQVELLLESRYRNPTWTVQEILKTL